MAFNDVRNLLLIGHNDGFIDDDEFVLLYDLYASKNPDLTYDSYAPFESESLEEFRFRKRDVRNLKEVLQIPETIICSQRSVCDGLEGLCVLLKRLSYPYRYGDMIHRFAKPVTVLSMITNQMIDFQCIMFMATEYLTGTMRSLALSTCRHTLML